MYADVGIHDAMFRHEIKTVKKLIAIVGVPENTSRKL